jgi:hypothetical protein
MNTGILTHGKEALNDLFQKYGKPEIAPVEQRRNQRRSTIRANSWLHEYRAQTHMWTAPPRKVFLRCFDQIACAHMSGLSRWQARARLSAVMRPRLPLIIRRGRPFRRPEPSSHPVVRSARPFRRPELSVPKAAGAAAVREAEPSPRARPAMPETPHGRYTS